MFAWFYSWRERRAFRKLCRVMVPLLRKRYGGAHFYTTGQVVTTAKSVNLSPAQQFCVIALFVKIEEADALLSELGSPETCEQIRRRLLNLGSKTYREDNFEESISSQLDRAGGSGGGADVWGDSFGGHGGDGSHGGHH